MLHIWWNSYNCKRLRKALDLDSKIKVKILFDQYNFYLGKDPITQMKVTRNIKGLVTR